jgi:hypothetical protein
MTTTGAFARELDGTTIHAMIVSFEPGSKGTLTHSPCRGLAATRAAEAPLLAGNAVELEPGVPTDIAAPSIWEL